MLLLVPRKLREDLGCCSKKPDEKLDSFDDLQKAGHRVCNKLRLLGNSQDADRVASILKSHRRQHETLKKNGLYKHDVK